MNEWRGRRRAKGKETGKLENIPKKEEEEEEEEEAGPKTELGTKAEKSLE
jgi:hypothetical protein